MEKKQASKLTKQLKRVFSEQALNGLGKRVGFCRRERDITPFRLCLGLVEVMGVSKIATIADIHRSFNALCDSDVQYKPFHNQLAKKQFPEFMRLMCERLMEQLACEALHFSPDSPLARFERVELQDGTSFAVKSTLGAVFPGRFTKVSPAAVELHVTLELLSEQPSCIVLTPDTESEAQYLPAPQTLGNSLVMGDRGYFKKAYLREVDRHGGCFIVKGKANMTPTVLRAVTADGVRRKRWENKSLKDIRATLSKTQPIDMDVQWPDKDGPIDSRMIVSWNRETKTYQYLLTNLARDEFSLEQILDAYRLRWQIELLFKDWKSYSNLHAFDTSNPYLAEGLIWAALCSAILKRYCALMTQPLAQVPISTRKVAMCFYHVMPAIFRCLLHCHRKLRAAVRHALEYLSRNATRAHPKRDALSGRAKLGLLPIYCAA
jgi:hypothetical protein